MKTKAHHTVTTATIAALMLCSSAVFADAVKTIKVDKSSFSAIYPAVWFNPEKGTTHPLVEESEKPPVEGASIWIEPSDPEFAAGPGLKDVTFCFVGYGEKVFSKPVLNDRLVRVERLEKSVLSSDEQPVVVIEAGASKSVIMIERTDTEAQVIEFKWRPYDAAASPVVPALPAVGAGPKAIVVGKASFSDIYPAVWMDPRTGTIHPISKRGEAPPVEGASVWIEPRDPEFAVAPDAKGMSFCVVGYGEEVFSGVAMLKLLSEKMENTPKVPPAILEGGRLPVIVIATTTGKSAIIIDRCDPETQTFEFRWRSLAAPEPNRAETERRLRGTILETIAFDGTMPWEAIEYLRMKFRDGNPGYLTGRAEWYTEAPGDEAGDLITLSARNMSVWNALQAVSGIAGLKVEISADGIVKVR